MAPRRFLTAELAHSVAALLLFCAALPGCGGGASEQIAKAAHSVQGAVEQAKLTAAQATGVSEGSVELTLGGPVKVEKCFARFTPKGAARPGVLQLMTYEDPQEEEFPSVFLWATCDAVSADELVGKTVEGQLFVQLKPGRELWSSSNLVPITIAVSQADLLSVTCEISDARVMQADGEAQVKASGKLVGVWRQGKSSTAPAQSEPSTAGKPASKTP